MRFRIPFFSELKGMNGKKPFSIRKKGLIFLGKISHRTLKEQVKYGENLLSLLYLNHERNLILY